MCDSIGGQKIQPLLRANADGGELIRHGNGIWGGNTIHSIGSEGHVATLQVPEGCDSSSTETKLRGARRKGPHDKLGANQGGDSEAKDARAKPETTKGVPSDGNNGPRSLATTTWFA